MREIWWEKHRPSSADGVIGQEVIMSEISAILSGEAPMQNYIFHSKEAGTGKTTVARLIADTLGYTLHQFNASSKRQRGIEFVEEDISPMSRTGQNETIFLLDEADRITPHAQDALKGVIEDSNAYFILTVNDLSKVTPYLKSRCQVRTFEPIDDDLALARLANIASQEGAEVTETDLRSIVTRHTGDLRNAIGALQTLAHLPPEQREAFTLSLQVDEVDAEQFLRLTMLEKSLDEAVCLLTGRPRDAIRSVLRYAVSNPARQAAKMQVIEAAIEAERDLIEGVDESMVLHNFTRMLCE